ncbi:hypothetical protein ABZS66_00050 [Dactylosporangium sp. NPDC005572]|uniref:hypothetical protein n=1 Tax=Dactylosporangium sp. NPDC005572 TaxID=3156889 RepID=UPI0033BE6398
MTTGQAWPVTPEPGHLAELPLAAPLVLLDALGYRGDDQHVAIHVGPRGAVHLDDGASRDDGDLLAWHRFTTHPATAPLHGYNLGGNGQHADVWLLIDRDTNQLSIGHPADITKILDAQPHTRDRLTGNLAPSRAHSGIVHPELRAARAPTGPDWAAQASRTGYLLDAITRGLDQVHAATLVDDITALATQVSDQISATPTPPVTHDAETPARDQATSALTLPAAEPETAAADADVAAYEVDLP